MTSLLVPYITSWSAEETPAPEVVHHSRGGIAYADEHIIDRDANGVLWTRVLSRPRHGRPIFGKVHSLRQRRAMSRLLCQVCAGPADRTDDGVLWMLKDHREDWPNWPETMACTEPPICLNCARISRRACPALRRGHVTVRVGHSTISGVHGMRYQTGPAHPIALDTGLVAFDSPRIRWTLASRLLRELFNCTIVELDDTTPSR